MSAAGSARRLWSGCIAALGQRLRAPARRGRERGTFSIAVVIWVLMTVVLGAFVVDGGLSISERERAGDLAQQAARAVANFLDTNDLRTGTIVIDFNADGSCNQDEQHTVLQLLEADGLQDTDLLYCGRNPADNGETTTMDNGVPVQVPDIMVTINVPYSPLFTGMFYKGKVSVTASATAYPEPGI
ncbi:MAG TPA: Tad domain-containing protein [Actinocrinis sp.]|jgi:hypothetical protein